MKKTVISLVTIAIVALFAGLAWSAEEDAVGSLQYSAAGIETGIIVASNDVEESNAADEEVTDEEESDDGTSDEEAADDEASGEGSSEN